jgi:hypothetical protein
MFPNPLRIAETLGSVGLDQAAPFLSIPDDARAPAIGAPEQVLISGLFQILRKRGDNLETHDCKAPERIGRSSVIEMGPIGPKFSLDIAYYSL